MFSLELFEIETRNYLKKLCNIDVKEIEVKTWREGCKQYYEAALPEFKKSASFSVADSEMSKPMANYASFESLCSEAIAYALKDSLKE